MTTARVLKAVRVRDANGVWCVAYQEQTPIIPLIEKWMNRINAACFIFVVCTVLFVVASANAWI